MKNNRRNFLKLTGLTGFSLIGSALVREAAGLSSDGHNFRNPATKDLICACMQRQN